MPVISIKRNILQLLTFSNITPEVLSKIWTVILEVPSDIMKIIDTDCKYDFYIKKQEEDDEQDLLKEQNEQNEKKEIINELPNLNLNIDFEIKFES